MNLSEPTAVEAARLLETALEYHRAVRNCPPEPKGDYNTPEGVAHMKGLREAERRRSQHFEAIEAYARAVEKRLRKNRALAE